MNLSNLKLKWKWRKFHKSEFPLHYTGKTDMFITHGTPLILVRGVKGTSGAGRYMRPNGVEIHLHRKDVTRR